MVFVWFSKKVEKRISGIDGRGLFAVHPIGAGELVLVKGGHVFERAERDRLAKTLGPSEIQIDDDLFIGPNDAEDREHGMMHLNHSCDPNVGVQGQVAFFAMRAIGVGDELTMDYATFDNDDWEMVCKCGAVECRKRVTGRDWMRPDLQARYDGWFSLYIAKKIAAERD